MQLANKFKREQEDLAKIEKVLVKNYEKIIAPFYEMQTNFLSSRYKINKSLESSNILTLLGKGLHLAILREREKYLDFDISLNNFYKINDYLREKKYSLDHGYKIVTIVQKTGIPKETVRRKLKKLVDEKVVNFDNKNKIYNYNLTNQNEELYKKFIEDDINSLSRFLSHVIRNMGFELKIKNIENEIKSKFSFYYYHFYSCQLDWLRMWQTKLKDVDLVFIAIQALIPTLKYTDEIKAKNKTKQNLEKDSLHTLIGKTNQKKYKINVNAINASSISEISGIPRATCIRKLQKLIKLGLLVKDTNSKGYFVNQNPNDRNKYITNKENISFTIDNFGNFLAIASQALSRNVRSLSA